MRSGHDLRGMLNGNGIIFPHGIKYSSVGFVSCRSLPPANNSKKLFSYLQKDIPPVYFKLMTLGGIILLLLLLFFFLLHLPPLTDFLFGEGIKKEEAQRNFVSVFIFVLS